MVDMEKPKRIKPDILPRRVHLMVVWFLHLFCIFQKSVDIVLESVFVVLRVVVLLFHSVNKGLTFYSYIMKIGLPAFLTVFVVVDNPCSIEAFQEKKGEMLPKLTDGNFKSGILLFQDLDNIHGIIGPLDRSRVQAFEFSVNSIFELGGGANVNAQPIANETYQASKRKSENKDRPLRQDKYGTDTIGQFLHDNIFIILAIAGVIGMIIGFLAPLP